MQRHPFLAGSSAGAMTLPFNNIFMTRNSGDSYTAVKEGKVENFGIHGFRIFRWGLVDAHVGERGRQGRLFVLHTQTKTKYSFGLDENTGFIDNGSELEMVGGGYGPKGTLIMQGTNITEGTFHYLTEGDKFHSDGSVEFANWKRPCENSTDPLTQSKSIFSHFRMVSLQYARSTVRTSHFGLSGLNPVVIVTFMKRENFKVMCGTINGNDHVSFSNMQISMGKRAPKEGFVGEENINMEKFYIDN